MLVLVTGASGMLGSETVRWLERAGIEYHKFIRIDEDMKKLRAGFKPNLPKYDAVIHCAGIPKQAYNPEDPAAVFRANVLMTQEIIEMVGDKEKPPLFIFPSSIAVYGDTGFYYRSENTKVNPTNLYSISKLTAEGIVDFYTKMGFIDGYSFRLSALVGNRKSGPVYDLFQQARYKEELRPFGVSPGSTKIYTAVYDVARFFTYFTLSHEQYLSCRKKYYHRPAFNLCSDHAFSILQIAEQIKEYLHVDKPIIFNGLESYIGDNNSLLANSNLAKELFDWNPKYKKDVITYGCDMLMFGQA